MNLRISSDPSLPLEAVAQSRGGAGVTLPAWLDDPDLQAQIKKAIRHQKSCLMCRSEEPCKKLDGIRLGVGLMAHILSAGKRPQ